MPAATTLSTICTYAGPPRRRSRVQLRTGPSSPPKPQAEASPATGNLAGERPREHHRAGFPHITYPACSGPSRRSKPVHLPSTRDAPSTYFSQTLATGNAVTIPGPLHHTQRIRSAPASTRGENDTRRKSRSACPIDRPLLPNRVRCGSASLCVCQYNNSWLWQFCRRHLAAT